MTFLAIQSDANGVPKRRNMWSQVSHQPPMSKNIGDSGFGQCRSSRTQNSSASPSRQLTGKPSSPRNVPSTSPASGIATSCPGAGSGPNFGIDDHAGRPTPAADHR